MYSEVCFGIRELVGKFGRLVTHRLKIGPTPGQNRVSTGLPQAGYAYQLFSSGGALCVALISQR